MPQQAPANIRSHKLGLALLILCIAAPFTVGSSLFIPVMTLYRGGTTAISDEDLAAWQTHLRSNRDQIAEANSYTVVGFDGDFHGAQAVRAADEILDGRLNLAAYESIDVTWPFSADDLFQGGPSLQLRLCSLIVGEILLEAYAHTSESKYFRAAREYALALIDYERSLWLPKGYILNDQAVAARSIFLTKIVTLIADQPDADTEIIKKYLKAIDRSVALLGHPRYFAYHSNHGLMQSLAVFHAGVVAPLLPSVRKNLQNVFDRTDLQLQYLVSNSGVVTEHSPGYQRFNLALVAMLLRYASILEHPIPDHWIHRYQRAEIFLNHLQRPDGTLPRYGDTGGQSSTILGVIRKEVDGPFDLSELEKRPPREGLWIDTDFGYWSEWRGGTHLMAGWADFGPRTHKHANELSLIFWWQGQEWWTAGGYWPWGTEYRKSGTSWNGSNAPHLVAETANSDRSADVVSWYSDPDIALLQLRRSGPSNSFINRIVIRLYNDCWIVLDSLDSDGEHVLESIWPTLSDIDVKATDNFDAQFWLHSDDASFKLRAEVLTGPGAVYEWRRGSLDPFIGWTAEAKIIKETSALVLNAPAGSWHGIAWQPVAKPIVPTDVLIKDVLWTSQEKWIIAIASDQGDLQLTRDNDYLVLSSPVKNATFSLNTPRFSEAKQLAETAYSKMKKITPNYREALRQRIKIFKLAVIAGVCQLILLLLILRYIQHRWVFPRSPLAALLIAHIGFGFWIHLHYFSSA
jgi:hypothetical protein